MSLKGKEALHMYQIGIDIGGTNVKIGLPPQGAVSDLLTGPSDGGL